MEEEVKGVGGAPNRELYALLDVSPEATDEEIRKAYRQWAQIYHPDKYQAAQVLHHPNFFPFLGWQSSVIYISFSASVRI